jgi:hypothetical protein
MELFTQVEQVLLELIQTVLLAVAQELQAMEQMLQERLVAQVDLVVVVGVVVMVLAAQEFFTFTIRMELL